MIVGVVGPLKANNGFRGTCDFTKYLNIRNRSNIIRRFPNDRGIIAIDLGIGKRFCDVFAIDIKDDRIKENPSSVCLRVRIIQFDMKLCCPVIKNSKIWVNIATLVNVFRTAFRKVDGYLLNFVIHSVHLL